MYVTQFEAGNHAVKEFKSYLQILVYERQQHPVDPQTDVLTHLLHDDIGALSETELLHQCIFLEIVRKPNKHFAFAGGPRSFIGLNLAKMEGRVAIGKFLERFPHLDIKERWRSPRIRFRGFEKL